MRMQQYYSTHARQGNGGVCVARFRKIMIDALQILRHLFHDCRGLQSVPQRPLHHGRPWFGKVMAGRRIHSIAGMSASPLYMLSGLLLLVTFTAFRIVPIGYFLLTMATTAENSALAHHTFRCRHYP